MSAEAVASLRPRFDLADPGITVCFVPPPDEVLACLDVVPFPFVVVPLTTASRCESVEAIGLSGVLEFDLFRLGRTDLGDVN